MNSTDSPSINVALHSGRWATLLHLVLIALVGALAYSNTFHVPFVFDDVPSIVDNPVIKDLTSFLGGGGYRFNLQRFVSYLSLALNYRLGGLDVTGYHIFNLTIHLLTAALLYALCRATLRTPRLRGEIFSRRGGWMALLAALLFVAHPLQTGAVTYVVQRVTLLATCFYLLSLLLYALGRQRIDTVGGGAEAVVREPLCEETPDKRFTAHGSQPFLIPGLFFAGSLTSAILAMHSKEIAFTLPLAILLYEVSFFRTSWRRRFLLLLPLLSTLVIIPMGLIGSGKSLGELLSVADRLTRESILISRHDYLLTQLRVIVTYLRLLFVPVGQNVDHDYPVYTTFFTPPVFLSFLFLSGLFSLAVWFFWKTGGSREQGTGNGEQGTGNRSLPIPDPQSPITDYRLPITGLRLIAFGIFWFFLTLLVESSVIPIRDVIYEHRLYLPSIGAALAVAAALMLLLQRRPRVLLLMAVVIVAGLAIATWQRNAVWGSELSLWRDALEKSPAKARPHHNYAKALSQAGQVKLAIIQYEKALILGSPSPETLVNLATEYSKAGRPDLAIKNYRAALADAPRHIKALTSLAILLLEQETSRDEGLRLLQQALAQEPNNANIHFNLGVAFTAMGNLPQAIEHSLQAIRLKPDYAKAYNNLGSQYFKQGRPDLAVENFRKAVQLEPENRSFRNNLEMALQAQ